MEAMGAPAAENREATEAWSGPLFERFVRYRDLVADGLGAHGEAALAARPPRPGDRVVDLGCGFGDTTQRLAELVWPGGDALGIDGFDPFIELARKEAGDAAVANIRFAVGDVQVAEFEQSFDYAFSRMGIMFFANPVQALRNVRKALTPGGRVCAVVCRRKLDNEWVSRAEAVVEQYLDRPEETDQPTCGPGPFSMANADTVSEPLKIADDLDHAVEFNMALGPAGEVLRLWEDRIDEIRPKIAAELRQALADLERPDGDFAPASTWIISAR